MGYHTNHDQPFGLLDTVLVPLRISKSLDLNALGFLDFIGSSVTDENGLASPFDEDLFLSVPQFSSTKDIAYVLPFRNGRQIDLDLSHGQNIRGRRHVHKEICESTKHQHFVPIDFLAPLFTP